DLKTKRPPTRLGWIAHRWPQIWRHQGTVRSGDRSSTKQPCSVVGAAVIPQNAPAPPSTCARVEIKVGPLPTASPGPLEKCAAVNTSAIGQWVGTRGSAGQPTAAHRPVR